MMRLLAFAEFDLRTIQAIIENSWASMGESKNTIYTWLAASLIIYVL